MQEAIRTTDLRTRLVDFAKRSVGIMGACTNEESTKLHLVMPLLGLLGYDHTNPYEVYPEHAADFATSPINKVDLAILRDGVPIIAVECKKAGADLTDDRGQLRSYFNALVSAKLGILTNGIVFEFFVDSDEPNIMDEEPFLTLELETAARAGIADEVLDALICVTKANFDPDTIAEAAHVQLVRKRLRTILAGEFKRPSEDFCRLVLKKVDIKNVSKSAIDRHYGPMIKTALDESLVLPAVQRMRSEMTSEAKTEADLTSNIGQRIFTTDREMEVYEHVRRRLAFLVEDEAHFEAVEGVQYKDYVGKLRIFYWREHKGRLLDYIEGADGYDKFIFPDPVGAIITNNLLELDNALKATFIARVRSLSSDPYVQRLARSAS